ncbi:hypothetical protein PACTADRAFT_21291, partial [Pachysolen tannophilus NRRL Y-2460]
IRKPYNLYRYYFLSEKQTNEFDLNWNLNPMDSIRKLYHYKPRSFAEGLHYTFLFSTILFVFIILPVSFFVKFLIFAFFSFLFTVPMLSQFFFSALPILTWVFFYFSASKIPTSWRPPISVKYLPSMETIFYGDNLSDILATSTNMFLDLLAWFPYGIIHFSVPFILAAFIFLFAPPTALRSYATAFGYMNLLGVIVQSTLPAAPPWYKVLYGLEPADYSMTGSAGGLGRIDKLFGFDMYSSNFANSPVIFGAFPSLHSGAATMEALFLSYLFPRFKPLWWGYVFWLWWCTMYLTHHYFIDLIAGSCLSLICFATVKYTTLPIRDRNKFCRFSYTKLEYVNLISLDPSPNYHPLND